MIDPSEITKARRALGQQLAAYRRAAGYNQQQLAAQTHYGRSTIANVETGRQHVPRAFWERCDTLFDTGQALVQAYETVEALVTRHQQETAALAGRQLKTPTRVDLVAVAQLRELVHLGGRLRPGAVGVTAGDGGAVPGAPHSATPAPR